MLETRTSPQVRVKAKVHKIILNLAVVVDSFVFYLKNALAYMPGSCIILQ